MKLALLVNPVASSVSGRNLVLLKKVLGKDHELVVHETSRQGHATRLAHRSYREGCDAVFTLGGDGTINEAANGLLDTPCPVAPLPGGSTNVFARAIGYPNNAVTAASLALAALEAGSIIRAGVGMADDRAFLFHVGAGFDAAVVNQVESRGTMKRIAGHPWFLACAVSTWLKQSRLKDGFTADFSNGTHLEGLRLAVTLNTNPYTFLGDRPLDLAPEATLTSELSVVALSSLSLNRLLPAAKLALFPDDEGLPNRGALHHLRDITSVTYSGTTPFRYQLDGEPHPPVNSLTVSYRPDALSVVVPTKPGEVRPS